MGTSPPAVSLRKLREEERVMKKQQEKEARSREAATAKMTSTTQARCALCMCVSIPVVKLPRLCVCICVSCVCVTIHYPHRTPSGWQKLTSPHSVQDGSPPPSFAAIVRAEEQVFSDKTK